MRRGFFVFLLIFMLSRPVIADIASRDAFQYSLDTFFAENDNFSTSTLLLWGYTNRGVEASVPITEGDVFTLSVVEPAIHASGSPAYVPGFGPPNGNESSIFIPVSYISTYFHIKNGDYQMSFSDGIDASGFIINITTFPAYLDTIKTLFEVIPKVINTTDSFGFSLNIHNDTGYGFWGNIDLEYFTSNGLLKSYSSHHDTPLPYDIELRFVESTRVRVKIPFPFPLSLIPLFAIFKRFSLHRSTNH